MTGTEQMSDVVQRLMRHIANGRIEYAFEALDELVAALVAERAENERLRGQVANAEIRDNVYAEIERERALSDTLATALKETVLPLRDAALWPGTVTTVVEALAAWRVAREAN